MSYARFTYADVYVFDDVRGGFTCCSCALLPDDGLGEFRCATPRQIIDHLNSHVAAGHAVPDYTFAAILADYPELDAEVQA